MTAALIVLVVLLAGALALVTVRHLPYTRRGHCIPRPGNGRDPVPVRRAALSGARLTRRSGWPAPRTRADAVFLARVPLTLPLDAPLPRQSGIAIPLQEAIEHRASVFGVPVDARIERGRTDRHALRQMIANEHYDRIVVAAAAATAPRGSAPMTSPGCSTTPPGTSWCCVPGARTGWLRT